MCHQTTQSFAGAVWALAAAQHGVLTRTQLLALGVSGTRSSIGWRRVACTQFIAGCTPSDGQLGRWSAAVLSCGPDAVLSHASAAVLWEITRHGQTTVDVSVPMSADSRRPGRAVHRRRALAAGDVTRQRGIPVTTPACTLIDIGACLGRRRLEAAINEADRRDLVDPESLRTAVTTRRHRPGLVALRDTLDRRTFCLTDLELERRFLPLVRQAGLTALRFTHAQVRFDSERVVKTLAGVARRCRERGAVHL